MELVDWKTPIHTRAFLPIILSKKLIELGLSVAGVDPTTLKGPIALLAPICAAALGTGQLCRFPKVHNIHGRRLLAAMTACG